MSQELETDPPIYGPSAPGTTAPRAAWNGSVFLAAWMEQRAGPTQVFATRVAADGQILDPTSIPIGDVLWGLTWTAAVGSDGNDFVVVWDQYDQTAQTSAQLASWVASDGTLTSPTPLVVASPVDAWVSDVVFDGARYLVLGHATGVSLRTLDASKNVGAPVQLAQPPTGYFPTAARGACVSQSCFVAWAESNATTKDAMVRIARVVDGVPVAGSVDTVASYATDVLAVGRPGVGCATSGCVVAWSEEKALYGKKVGVIRGTRLAWDGTILDPSGFDVLVPSNPAPFIKPDSFAEPSVVPVPSGFVVFAAGKKNNLARVGFDASVVPIATALGAYGALSSDLVAGSSGLLAAWSSGHAFGLRLALDGTPLDPPGFYLTRAANAQGQPAVAATDAGYLVSWEDSRGPDPGSLVHATRFDPAGTIVDSPAIPVVDVGIEGFNPVSVHDDSGFVVAFTSPSGGHANIRRVSESLVPFGPTTAFPFTVYPDRIALAPLGAETLAVAPLGGGLVGQLLTAAGEWSDAGAAQWIIDGGANLPAATSDGARALVLYRAGPQPGPGDVEVVRVDSTGALVGGAPLVLASDATSPAAAFGAGHYLLAWLGAKDASIHLRLVDDQLDGLHCAPEQVIQGVKPYVSVVRATFDGAGFLIVWSAEVGNDSVGAEAFAARVRADGVLLDPSGFELAPDARAIAVASTQNGSSLAAYGRYDSDPKFRAARVKAVLVTSGTPPVLPGELDAGPCLPVSPPDAGADAADASDAAADASDAAETDATEPSQDAAEDSSATDATDAGGSDDVRKVDVYPSGGCSCECRSLQTPLYPLAAFLLGLVARSRRRRARR